MIFGIFKRNRIVWLNVLGKAQFKEAITGTEMVILWTHKWNLKVDKHIEAYKTDYRAKIIQ